MMLHERMKEIQTDSDKKVRTLAEYFGVSENCLGNYLNGKRTVPYELLIAFAQYFQVTTDYLFGLAEDPHQPYMVSVDERALLDRFRSLSENQKELIEQMVDFMLKQKKKK